VNGLKDKLRQYPLTIIYLPLKWCGYAYKLFLDEMGEKSHIPPGDRTPEKCLFAQSHVPQTQLMKHEIMKHLQGPDETRSIRVVFATVAIGSIESYFMIIVMAWGRGTSLLYIYSLGM
jgi:hypothetical protein